MSFKSQLLGLSKNVFVFRHQSKETLNSLFQGRPQIHRALNALESLYLKHLQWWQNIIIIVTRNKRVKHPYGPSSYLALENFSCSSSYWIRIMLNNVCINNKWFLTQNALKEKTLLIFLLAKQSYTILSGEEFSKAWQCINITWNILYWVKQCLLFENSNPKHGLTVACAQNVRQKAKVAKIPKTYLISVSSGY